MTRARLATLLVVAACAATSPTGSSAPHSTDGPRVVHVALTVAELEPARSWFRAWTDAELEVPESFEDDGARWGLGHAHGRAAALTLGAERVVLLDFDGVGPASSAVPAVSNDPRFQHLALVVGDIDARWSALREHVTAVSPEPQRIPDDNVAAAGIRAAYFRGPDGHPLELIAYPPDKGAAAWHRADDRVLGIDHTAIVVADTAASLAFYRDLLGLDVVGESLNEGVEQSRLSGVAGARVRITGLRGSTGMGVELLEYEAPGLAAAKVGAVPADDLAHAATTIAVDDLVAVLARMRELGTPPISRAPSPCIGCREPAEAFMVADPDGHVVQIVGPTDRSE